MINPRLIAAQSLCKVQRDGAWSNLVLDHQLRDNEMESRDSAFAGALFYGVLERVLTLDACIAAHCNVKLRKLSMQVLTALRLGVYQLLYMDSVPDSAAVNESVALVRDLGQHKSAALVNAVLRSFLRGDKQVPLPEEPLERLSVEYSCPAWLIGLWRESYGEAAAKGILERSLAKPPLFVRVNTQRTTDGELISILEEAGVKAAPEAGVPHCLRLEKPGSLSGLAAYKEGLFHVQDRSAQLCVLALDPKPGMGVLDACAAPGGKAFTAAQMMKDRGELVAADLYPQRVGLIEKRAGEMGLGCIRPLEMDMTRPDPGLGLFDRVLCDVPCSGLGVISRKPEIKYKPQGELEHFPRIQYKILENAANYCKAGGLLIYSTCTLNPGENQEVVGRFLSEHPDFAPGRLPEVMGGGEAHTFLEGDGDGFFVAALTRKG